MRRLEHVIGVGQFDRPFLDDLCALAREMEDVAATRADRRLRGRILATLFFEPSTRTRLSFESAMYRLGGEVISMESGRETSSAAKGETIEDTVRIVEGYADAIALRHYEEGAAARAAAVARVPILNAGDGGGEHPTQALLDLYTIWRELGRIDGLRVALVGDLWHGRAARSLALLLAETRGLDLVCVAPPGMGLRPDVLARLAERGVHPRQEADLAAVLPTVDVVYQTRVQRERFSDPAAYERARGVYVIDRAALALLPPGAVLMHPLPRVGEITPDVDADPRAAYFREAHNGVYVRMALLAACLGGAGQGDEAGA
ncbi:MAG TPA: aspartate carbamoyltransferase [Thermomicrobiales bacterium]|nr:aspartate carbamoyltransferase [Thermomicrobiales bacterium]